MKASFKKYTWAILAFAATLSACEPDEFGSMNFGNYTDTEGSLKDAASFPIGMAINYNQFMSDPNYKAAVVREADNVTFEYHMKHGALVRNDGSIDFTSADRLFDAASAAGLEVFGHTLGWHSNQNATYLNSLAGSSGPAPQNLILNGSFEAGSGNSFTNWGVWNGASSVSATTVATEKQEGARGLKVVVAANGNPWNIQVASDLFPTQTGKQYRVTFHIKAANAGGKMRLSTQGGTPQYSPDFNTSTDWGQFTWTFPATDAQTRIMIDIGSTANTYFLDNFSVVDASTTAPPTGAEVAAKVDNALQTFISQTVTRYKGKVKAWDVVNEPMADGNGALRVRANSGTIPATATDKFFWADYLGRNWGLKAFQYAAAADPNALLFINDYNLESNNAKLDSLIQYTMELKQKGAKINGIGTQMHISTNTSYAGIVNMFKKLAATGLLVRVSELDVQLNPSELSYITDDAQHRGLQAAMYKFVLESYIKYVPANQRHGFTIWGVNDPTSWLVLTLNKNDFPLLFDKDYNKKPAYSALLQTLKANK
ncbi:endo-1,4-beta-xylanase [Rufibacter ruber]|uniref:endo-1,4-beta-xylanase n=1 Tax=Rufibacter ruber TaxID=1783499 RepID=UPI00082D096D|nr:endo-1,4-beta-xylanase [Rufibacter ruber]